RAPESAGNDNDARSRRVPGSPPSRFVSEGGSRISTSACQERESAFDVDTERVDRVERDARDRAARTRPFLPLVEALLHRERTRVGRCREPSRARLEALTVDLGIRAHDLDEPHLRLVALSELHPLLARGD